MMLKFINFLLLTCFITLTSTVSMADKLSPAKITHVIYVTLDGTRWQDVFINRHNLALFWQKYARFAKIYGAPHSRSTMEVASIPVSLPSYQSQMSGAVQSCDGNTCGRIKVETLPEYLIKHDGLQKYDVATFASWSEIENAVEHEKGMTFVNTGNFPVTDPITGKADRTMDQINIAQSKNHSNESLDRYDQYTFAHAMHYLEKFKPRFMWISLQDTDEAAHENNRKEYYQALKYYDIALDTLFTTLKKLKLDKNTMVIVTTDHGRGNDVNWTSHGVKYPESKRTWAFVFNGDLMPINSDADGYHYNTLSIRPTIEDVFKQKG